jgi:hypothetical protein
MSAIYNMLLLSGLASVGVTIAWDGFLSYEFFRFAEFMF